jgi:hypothetical protein
VLYQDLLLGLFDKNFEGIDLKGHYLKKLDALRNIKIPADLSDLFAYHELLLQVLAAKCDLGLRIRAAYLAKDLQAVSAQIEEIQNLYDNVQELHRRFSTVWNSTNKPFGLERIDIRYGGLLLRLKVTEGKLRAVADAPTIAIPELDEKRLMFGGDDVAPGKSLLECVRYASEYVRYASYLPSV